jgi:hypothetical protein
VELDGPEGAIKSLPSNHLMHQVYLVEGDRNHSFKVITQYDDVMPEYEQSVCNLLEDPDTSMQFTPES